MRLKRKRWFDKPETEYFIVPVVLDIKGSDVDVSHVKMYTDAKLDVEDTFRLLRIISHYVLHGALAPSEVTENQLGMFSEAYGPARDAFLAGDKVGEGTAVAVKVSWETSVLVDCTIEIAISNDFADLEQRAMESDNGHIVG